MNLCKQCNNDFTSVTAFDRHQTGIAKIICHNPAEKGLELAADGKTWKLADDGTFDFAKKLDEPKSECYPVPCSVCNKGIKRTNRRGRPPKKHEECK